MAGNLSKNKRTRRDKLPMVSVHVPTQADIAGYSFKPVMIESISGPGKAGYVPLCSALLWIMTGGGVHRVKCDDEDAWRVAVDKLFSRIHTGEIRNYRTEER